MGVWGTWCQQQSMKSSAVDHLHIILLIFCSISIFFFHLLPFTEYMHIICLANIPSSPKMTITAEMSPQESFQVNL